MLLTVSAKNDYSQKVSTHKFSKNDNIGQQFFSQKKVSIQEVFKTLFCVCYRLHKISDFEIRSCNFHKKRITVTPFDYFSQREQRKSQQDILLSSVPYDRQNLNQDMLKILLRHNRPLAAFLNHLDNVRCFLLPNRARVVCFAYCPWCWTNHQCSQSVNRQHIFTFFSSKVGAYYVLKRKLRLLFIVFFLRIFKTCLQNLVTT